MPFLSGKSCISPSGTNTEKLSRAGRNTLQLPPLTGARKPSGSAGELTFEEGTAAATREAIKVKLLSSGVGRSGADLFTGVATAFNVAAGAFRIASALAKSHGATGLSCCHNPRRSLRAAASD